MHACQPSSSQILVATRAERPSAGAMTECSCEDIFKTGMEDRIMNESEEKGVLLDDEDVTCGCQLVGKHSEEN